MPALACPARLAPVSHDPIRRLATRRQRPLLQSRWLQLPLYLGLIVAQGVYVWYFMVELTHLVEAAFGSQDAMEMILRNVTPAGAERSRRRPRRWSCWSCWA